MLPIGANQGFTLEVILLLPFAIGYAVWVGVRGEATFLQSGGLADNLLLIGCGVVTAVSIALILVHNLWRLVSGQLSESELIGVRESEEEPIDVPAPLK